jgi:flagellar biosynthetic protein FliS
MYGAYAKAEKIIDVDDKPRVLLKVFQTILEKMDLVKAATDCKNFAVKYEELSKITTVIEVLNGSLDMSHGEVPQNLSNLYGYVAKRLRELHSSMDTKVLDECRYIVSNIHEGFTKAWEKERKEQKGHTDSTGSNVNQSFMV